MNTKASGKDPFRVMRLILELRQAGITDSVILNAFESLPRDMFLESELSEFAYDDVALPIACGQTVTRPSIVAVIVNALDLSPRSSLTVLEIGTGSGFMTGLLSKMARRVHTIDRYRTLTEAARARFEALGLTNIVSQCADGQLGWSAAAPFDRIVSTCATEVVPEAWFRQLKSGGILIAPLGTNEDQNLIRYHKNDDGKITSHVLEHSDFLHLTEGVAKEL